MTIHSESTDKGLKACADTNRKARDKGAAEHVAEEGLACNHLAVGYNGTPLISDVCFAVRPGKILTLIGPNGAGKSTILKSITGQLKTLGGVVYLNGKSENTMSNAETAREMAVVLTERRGTEWMTCRDVVALGRYPYTGRLGILSDEDREKVEETLRKVGAESIADQDFAEVSDGQRQRVLLARALCQEAKILVLDEPTSFLDLHYKRSLLRLIWQAAREDHIAVVMSLHEIDLARQISDIVVCVKGDRIWNMGSPDEIFTEETIEQLFDLPQGSYDAEHGMLRLGLS